VAVADDEIERSGSLAAFGIGDEQRVLFADGSGPGLWHSTVRANHTSGF